MKTEEQIKTIRTELLESLAQAQGEQVPFTQGAIRAIDLILTDDKSEEVKED